MPKPDDVGVGTAICILNKRNQMLMLRRGKGSPHGAGTYSFPGGWIDRTDLTLVDAIKREVAEEVGITINKAELAAATTSDFPEIEARCVTLIFLAMPGMWSGKPVNREPDKIEELVWRPLFGTYPSPLFGAMREAIRDLRRVVRNLRET